MQSKIESLETEAIDLSIRTILITHPRFSKMIDRVPDLSMKDGLQRTIKKGSALYIKSILPSLNWLVRSRERK